MGYSFYANVIVPAIPMVVQKKVLGSALGIMEIMSSIAECVIPIITASIFEKSSSAEIGYKNSSMLFFIIGLLGVAMSLSLFCVGKKIKRRLDKGDRKKDFSKEEINDFDIPSEYTKIEEDSFKQGGRKSLFNLFKRDRTAKQI